MRGDLGFSIFTNHPVSLTDRPAHRADHRAHLCAISSSACFAFPLGVVAAWKAGSWVDRAVMASRCSASRFPAFVLGYVLILVFSL